MTADPVRSNSLADLAARIRAEHEASAGALQRGFEHAVNAGRLLIEAKAKVGHGQWLPWLAEHCQMRERTCQAYMKVARAFDALGDDSKAQRVADLSFRDALNSLAVSGDLLANKLPPESFDRALALLEDGDGRAETWRRAIQHVRIEDARARFTLETPAAMLPLPNGRRKLRVARNPAERKWMLAIGPDISRAKLKEREQAAREAAVVRELQQQRDELLDRAAAREAEAKEIRKEADSVRDGITDEIRRAIGPAAPFTETYDFVVDEATDGELSALSQDELVSRLLAARGTVSEQIEETDRGYWGDMSLMWSQQITSGPPGPGRGWTGLGSPEWLEALFPNWNEPPDECEPAEPATACPQESVA